jgi:hypothetical protein
VTQKRNDHPTSPATKPDAAPEPATGLPEAVVEQPPASRMPLFWRLFGGTVVAAVAVVGVAVYQQMQSQVSAQRRELAALNKELRKDLAQIGGNYSEMIKKEDHGNRMRTVWDTIKELRSDRSDLTTMKERCSLLLEVYKSGEEERRALAAEVRRLRESKTASDERDALVREIRLLRERIAQLETRPGKLKVIQAGGGAEEQEKR